MSGPKAQVVIHNCGATFRVEYTVEVEDGQVRTFYYALDCPACGKPIIGPYPGRPTIGGSPSAPQKSGDVSSPQVSRVWMG